MKILTFLCTLLFTVIGLSQVPYDRPTIDGQFNYQQVDCENHYYLTTLQVSITNWNDPVVLDYAKTRFSFNTQGLDFVCYSMLNFTAENGYTSNVYLSSDGNKLWIELELEEGASGFIMQPDTFYSLVELNFTILDCNEFANICPYEPQIFRTTSTSGNLEIGEWLCDEENLPVELTSFTAHNTNEGIVLNWSTASELNNRGFEIIRNGDFVEFIPGHGTSTEVHNYTYLDKSHGEFSYRLRQLDFDGTFTYSNVIYVSTVSNFTLLQNYPNPFNGTTKIFYQVNNPSDVNLTVYDILGREVQVLVNEHQSNGTYSVDFYSDKSSAVYIYSLTINGQSIQKKMTVLK